MCGVDGMGPCSLSSKFVFTATSFCVLIADIIFKDLNLCF